MPFDPVAFFANPNKRIVEGAAWVLTGQDLRLVGFIEVNGVTSSDVQLRGIAERDFPDARVLLQIELMHGPGPLRPLSRIEWRSVRGHTNRKIGPNRRLHFKQIDGTHVHGFSMNWDAARSELWGENLPVADEPPIDLPSFEALVAFAGSEFRIPNLATLPPPPWEPLLGIR